MFYTLSQRTGLHHHQSMTLADHELIFSAIKQHDADAARTAMRSHLRHVEEVLSAPDEAAEPSPIAARANTLTAPIGARRKRAGHDRDAVKQRD
jgi:hypothetical protein